MTTPGYYLAEAYVMRKHHKQKMKQIEEEERAKRPGDVVSRVKRSSTAGGCFGMFKKIHPSNNIAQREVTGLDSKAL